MADVIPRGLGAIRDISKVTSDVLCIVGSPCIWEPHARLAMLKKVKGTKST